MTLQLRATPSFDAVMPMLMPLMAVNPFLTAWTEAMTQIWAPWMGMLPPPK